MIHSWLDPEAPYPPDIPNPGGDSKPKGDKKMGAMFDSYALERVIEQYFEREGVTARSIFRLFGIFAFSTVTAGGIVYIIGTILTVWLR